MSADRSQYLRGRTVVVTGASSGIGAAAGRHFVERGAIAAVVGRSPLKTAAVAEAIGGQAYLAARPALERLIPVPAIISPETFERAAQRLADNKRFASRNSKAPPCCRVSGGGVSTPAGIVVMASRSLEQQRLARRREPRGTTP